MIVNKKELSDIFGISERTLTKYQKLSDFPILVDAGRGHENQYNSQAVYRFLLSQALNGATKESAKERLDRVRANRETLAYAKDLKELVPAAEVAATLDQVVVAIKSTLINGVNKLKTEIDALYDIDLDPEILDDHNRSVLTHLSAINIESGSDSTGLPGAV
ncbi:MAG: DNA packaging protein [Proteobacteria bacterium]|nr:MAG: DNA packaging protein [Pseudomonadota bacterium]